MSHFIIWSMLDARTSARRTGRRARSWSSRCSAACSELCTTPSARLLDGVGGADLRADRILAVHADLRRGLHAVAPLDRLEVDHARRPRCVSHSRAGLHARLAADAARVVDEEGAARSSNASGLAARAARSRRSGAPPCVTRTAQILNSGIFEIGIDGANRAVVGRAVERPVVGNEHRVGPDGLHHLRAHDDRAAPALDA